MQLVKALVEAAETIATTWYDLMTSNEEWVRLLRFSGVENIQYAVDCWLRRYAGVEMEPDRLAERLRDIYLRIVRATAYFYGWCKATDSVVDEDALREKLRGIIGSDLWTDKMYDALWRLAAEAEAYYGCYVCDEIRTHITHMVSAAIAILLEPELLPTLRKLLLLVEIRVEGGRVIARPKSPDSDERLARLIRRWREVNG